MDETMCMDATYVYVNGRELCVWDASVEWMRLLCMIVVYDYMYNYVYMCDFPV
jgi:hypothetical protein